MYLLCKIFKNCETKTTKEKKNTEQERKVSTKYIEYLFLLKYKMIMKNRRQPVNNN